MQILLIAPLDNLKTAYPPTNYVVKSRPFIPSGFDYLRRNHINEVITSASPQAAAVTARRNVCPLLDVVHIVLYNAEEGGAIMETAMVTGRMTSQKKAAGNAVLQRAGMNASQAINRVYDRLIKDQDASFLDEEEAHQAPSSMRWKLAADFVDSISEPRKSRFHDMTKAEIKLDRLRSRGLL